jgi:hypothetical protein
VATGEYARVASVVAHLPPRLFALTDAVTGGLGVAAEEVPNYAQSDLISSDVMLLDTGASIYLWLGTAASENEKSEVSKVAAKYLEAGRRDPDTTITIVRSPLLGGRWQVQYCSLWGVVSGWSIRETAALVHMLPATAPRAPVVVLPRLLHMARVACICWSGLHGGTN